MNWSSRLLSCCCRWNSDFGQGDGRDNNWNGQRKIICLSGGGDNFYEWILENEISSTKPLNGSRDV